MLVRNYAGGAKWKKGHIIGRTGPVSYQVTVEGLTWSRHAGQLLSLSCTNKPAREESVGSNTVPGARRRDQAEKQDAGPDHHPRYSGTYTCPTEWRGADRQGNAASAESVKKSQPTAQDVRSENSDGETPKVPEQSQDGEKSTRKVPSIGKEGPAPSVQSPSGEARDVHKKWPGGAQTHPVPGGLRRLRAGASSFLGGELLCRSLTFVRYWQLTSSEVPVYFTAHAENAINDSCLFSAQNVFMLELV